jgi:PAS domain S-box-containing protein
MIQPCIVLVIDDNDANRYVTSRVLQQAGFIVKEATLGNEALRLATEQPDLIILDVKLPDIHGFEVCQRLKAEPSTALIPVLHLSAQLVTTHDRVQGLECGADGYLVQPVEPLELLATVKSLLRIRQVEANLQNSNERLTLALEAAQMGFWDWNLVTDEVTWTPHHELLLGYKAGTPHRNYQDWAERVHPDDLSNVEAVVQAAITTRRDYACDYRVIWPDGSEHWLTARGRPVYDGQNRPIQMLGVVYDITPQKQAQQERERLLGLEQAAREKAETMNRLKDEFLAIVSHELRTPLNALLAWSNMLRTRNFDAATIARGLDSIERNAKAQAQLVEDLLDVSRMVQGKLRLSMQMVHLPSIIQEAISTVQMTAQAKNMTLQADLGTANPSIWGDPHRLQQVVWNLLSNAIKFTPTGGRVDLELAAFSNHVQITVRDTGQGIKPEFLPYVFDRFSQQDGSTTRSHSGLGLGLTIVRQIVELHGGTVQVESAGEGQGATFTVTLPLPQPTVQTLEHGDSSMGSLS